MYPTDTVYGLGCDPFIATAVRRVFEAKRREGKPIPVLCASASRAGQLVSLGPAGKKLSRLHWPGALTIVAPLKRTVPFELDQGSRTLGVRVPGLGLCRDLVEACGGWLVGTSANISGSPPSKSVEEALGQLGSSVDMYLDGGPSEGVESTVVKLSDERITVLRQGQIGVGTH